VSFYDYSLPLALSLFLLAAVVVVAPAAVRLLIPRTLLRAEVPSRSPDDRILLLLKSQDFLSLDNSSSFSLPSLRERKKKKIQQQFIRHSKSSPFSSEK
jgi:hypothetical protein